ncbi:hypothetical protein CLV35_1473 [Motilibacter peucedani]|uniref:PH domain-containing protein n=1 Tax=Motilibacter peucedani TaxID=598650 RepID=A0A420XS94_9ACTN|nr:hypothetical protein [Motilibacter peucedani]RKS77775.1 hypothetical protein CLV35_1473 [Motilibacter peucedani]
MTGLAAHSAPLTRLGDRLLLTGAILAFLAVAYLLMWRGWKKRGGRQRDVPALPAVPEAVSRGTVRARAEGTYVVTTTAGDWLDRIVVHGLGVRSLAHLVVTDAGVLFSRVGAPDVFIPTATLRGARLERGMAGKFVEEGGLVVVTWQHGQRDLDTGFRPRAAADREAIVDAVRALAGVAS